MNDLISRQALCKYAINQKDMRITPNDIMRFPSAQPERKKGHWCDCWCSECGWSFEVESGFAGDPTRFLFCPNCGADMRGEQDE